jgi:hypothetical protein
VTIRLKWPYRNGSMALEKESTVISSTGLPVWPVSITRSPVQSRRASSR